MSEQAQQGWFPYGLLGYLLYNVGLFFILRKAGYTPWVAFVPLYNFYVTVKLAGWRGWALLWFLVPIVNIIAYVILCVDLAKAFARGWAWYLALVFFFPFAMLVLGLGGARFVGRFTGLERA